MELKKYRQKRNFNKTEEPQGEEKEQKSKFLRFVVQKHKASHLHYDFRLEVEGVLKSWAIPKGPSLNPTDKRLAIQVEDHPLEYRTFEGEIPKGNYGAGTVIVWDEGLYEAAGSTSHTESEAAILTGLEEGRLHFTLYGRKLQGGYSLVRLPKGKSNQWLLIKKQDEFSSTKDVTSLDCSVRSNRHL